MVRSARRDEHRAIAQLIADAFADDPIMTWAFGGMSSLNVGMHVLIRDLYSAYGCVRVESNLRGAAIWSLGEAPLTLSWWSALSLITRVARHTHPRHLARIAQLSDVLSKERPTERHLYLFMIGVDASARGAGVGGQLIREGLQHADQLGVPTALETSNPKNLALYQHLGFEIRNDVSVASSAPTVWTMVRRPKILSAHQLKTDATAA
ncbi:MAG: GNAT family N-acetyltransferase [Pseudomonadota bacterium]